MALRLVPLDEGSEIILDRAMVVVGRHPSCDARLDSLRVSRHHCCMIQGDGDVFVRDLGSTNGVRINSQRVESGRLRPGDELSIAHIRYRLDDGQMHASTLASLQARYREGSAAPGMVREPATPLGDLSPPPGFSSSDEDVLAAAVRRLLPIGMADKCKIQVIVEMAPELQSDSDDLGDEVVGAAANLAGENDPECHSDSCL
jgi:hypothetical protein